MAQRKAKVGFAISEEEETAKEIERAKNQASRKPGEIREDGGFTDLSKTLKRNKKLREEKMAAQRAAQAAENEKDARQPAQPKSAKQIAMEMCARAEIVRKTGATDKQPGPAVSVVGKFSLPAAVADTGNIVIIAGSGYVGAAILEYLAEVAPERSVLVSVRNPNSDNAKDLPITEKIHLVQGELGNGQNVVDIMANARVVCIIPPPVQDRVELVLQTINAAKAAQVKHLVVTSSTLLDYPNVGWMADSMAAIEQGVKASGIPYTIIRLAMFAENLFAERSRIHINGRISGTMASATRFMMAPVADHGIAIGAVLLKPALHAHLTYSIRGVSTSYQEISRALSEGLGKTIPYVQVGPENFLRALKDAGVSDSYASAMFQMYTALEKKFEADKEKDGSVPDLTSDFDVILTKNGDRGFHYGIDMWVTEHAIELATLKEKKVELSKMPAHMAIAGIKSTATVRPVSLWPFQK